MLLLTWLYCRCCGVRADLQVSEDAANVVFDVLCGSSRGYAADRIKVDIQLKAWRPDAETFDMQAFESSVLASRANLLATYGLVIGMQFAVFYALFLNPLAQRYIFKGA